MLDHSSEQQVQADAAFTLSSQGRERKDAIFAAMQKAAGRRRVRVHAVRGAALVLSAVVVVVVWQALIPAHRPVNAPIVAVHPAAEKGITTALPPVLPSPPSLPSPSSPARVVAAFVSPEAGIANRLSHDRVGERRVVAQVLSDTDLSGVLAGQETYGLAKVRGRVLVLDNRASAVSPVSVH